jgi:catechol 2,3-dioxygenase-like lactoylglutathione lyase family enzyme
MYQQIKHVTILVPDYDEAIKFYTEKLHFNLIENTYLGESKRWVLVSPAGSDGCSLLLAKAASKEQIECIGNQAGGRVFLFLYTDNFKKDYQDLIDNGITIVREPKTESYGRVAVFKDLYGNLWDLIEPVVYIS